MLVISIIERPETGSISALMMKAYLNYQGIIVALSMALSASTYGWAKTERW
jgi:hypothetical protein